MSESKKENLLRMSKNKIWKMQGIVSCFCDTCKKSENAGDNGSQNIDCSLYELLVSFCNVCGEKKGLKMCTVCKFSFYCSRECQVIDYPKHSKMCKMMKKVELGDFLMYYYLGIGNYPWKGFLQLKEQDIKNRLNIGVKFYCVIQQHDGEIRGGTEENIPLIENVQNNNKILGIFTSLASARKHQIFSVKKILKEEKPIKVMKGQGGYGKYEIMKNGLEVDVILGKQRYVRFVIIPFIADPKNLSKYLSSSQESTKRIKILFSWYWADMFMKSCFKILEVFEEDDNNIGLEIAKEREEGVERYNYREREVPDIVRNEDRKVIRKSMADICHYDIINIEVDKEYPPYILYDEIDTKLMKKIRTTL